MCSSEGVKVRCAVGYLYVVPYVGDRYLLLPERIPEEVHRDFRKYMELIHRYEFNERAKSLDALLDGLEGKLVRITVEVLE